MTKTAMILGIATVCTFAALSPATAAASEAHGYVAVGGAAIPEFEGADTQQAIPFIAAGVSWGGRYIAVEGVSARADLLASTAWEAGPLASLTFGRDDDVDSLAVRRMAQIDDAIELGGFFARSFQNVARSGDALRFEARAVSDVSDVHDGWKSQISAGYAAPINDRWRVGLDVAATVTSDEYAATYFSVTPSDAAASGLRRFDAGGGLHDVGLTLTAIYAVTPRWSVMGFAGYKRLLGDAADSPIVDREGSSGQVSAGLSLGRKF